MSLEQDQDILDMIARGLEIEAAQRLQSEHGLSPNDSLARVKELRNSILNPGSGDDPNIAEIDDLIRRSKKIEAIKTARQAYVMDLKDAKQFVERRESELGLRQPRDKSRKFLGIFG